MNKKNNEYNYEKYWYSEVDRVHDRYYEKLYDRIKSRISPEEGLKILDVGGGNGEFLDYLKIKNAVIFDISDSGLEIAQKRFNFNTVKGDIRGKFPFKDETFDFIYCCEVLEHLAHHEKIFQEISRILKKGGKLVISVPNMPIDGFHHKKRFKKKELKNFLEKNKLRIFEEFYNPKINGGHSCKEILRDKEIRIILKKIISNILGSIIPLKFKIYLANKNPDIFSGFFIIKAQK